LRPSTKPVWSRVDPTPLRTRRIDPPGREQGYPRQGTNVVTNPSEKIVTNPAHYGGLGQGGICV
jgi:hypothetical protein